MEVGAKLAPSGWSTQPGALTVCSEDSSWLFVSASFMQEDLGLKLTAVLLHRTHDWPSAECVSEPAPWCEGGSQIAGCPWPEADDAFWRDLRMLTVLIYPW